MNIERALKLADHLETNVKPETFDLITWWGRRDLKGNLFLFYDDEGCRTVGCAMGHGCVVFPDLLYIDDAKILRFNAGKMTPHPESKEAIHAFFEIEDPPYTRDGDEFGWDEMTLEQRFAACFYISTWIREGWVSRPTRDAHGPWYEDDFSELVTPKMMAAKIREYVRLFEAAHVLEAASLVAAPVSTEVEPAATHTHNLVEV